MIALSVACICVGGLASAWAWTATSNTNQVLTVRETVYRGEVIAEDDLVPVRLGVDPAIQAYPAERIGEVVGRAAQLDIAAGSVVTPGQLSDAAVPGPGMSVVGVSLAAGLLPADQITLGDKVRVVTTANDPAAGTSAPEGSATAVDGVVRGLLDDTVTGNTLVNVEVSADQAVRVASAAAAGHVALVLEYQAPAGAGPAGQGEAGTED
ncbi:SAF domain-containing protein [Myceligenerans indicum]|uniref:SAF domain-containing protein n=1 Tax=Myceligenerans indicum TaxID=2593663 RepID=A0ABS1LF02_9MICO|nr:SAF domain-containing protein [Myceligenerans indicum]MBL0884842.1 hypothetical protein [Myceligenerans indicum]